MGRVHRCIQDTADSPYRQLPYSRGWESNESEAHGNLETCRLPSGPQFLYKQHHESIRSLDRNCRLTTNLTLQDAVSDQSHLFHLKTAGTINAQCVTCLTHLFTSVSPVSLSDPSVSLTCSLMSCRSSPRIWLKMMS